MKGLKVLLVMLLVGCIAGGVYAKPAEVYLLPSSPGEPSKIVPLGDKPSALWLIQYDGGTSLYYLSGLLPGDTIGIFFDPPAACSLIEVHFCKYMYADEGLYTYWGIAADVPDGITIDDYGEYHSGAATPGPSPVGTMFASNEFDFPFTGDWQWDTLSIPGTPDIGTDAFFAGTVIGDSLSHSTRIDAGVSPPYRAIGYKQGGAGPAANGPGWYSSWHLFWVRALVKVYENIGPVIVPEGLLGTYNTGNRAVGIYTEDFGPTAAGIGEIHLYYYVEGKTDTLEVTVVQDSVDDTTPNFEYGWWHAEIPGQSAGSVVTYWVEGVDGEGAEGSSAENSYMIGAGTPGNGLLYVEEDEAWSIMDIHNAYTGHPWDLWYEYFGGVADSTVTDYYITGAGANAISWLTFSGSIFAEWSFDEAFRSFMDAGGCLFLAGQDVPGGGYDLGYGDWVVESPHPLADYLKVYAGTDDYIDVSPFSVFVDNTDVLTTGMPDEVEVDCGSIYQSTWVGIFTDIDAGCVPLFFDAEGNILGYRYEAPGGFKVVHLYFNFHAMTDTDAQDTFISNLTSYFEVGVEENTEPVVYNLPMVNPNPLSGPATVSFTIPKTEYVSVKVYDVTGSLVSNLVDERLTAGTHTLTINTESLTSGVYFLKMDAGTFSGTRKFVVMK